jgi:hypothetical protein
MEENVTPKPIKRHAKKLQTKAKGHTVLVDDIQYGRYKVISGGSGREYIVNVFKDGSGASCNCDWATKRTDSLVENKGATACSHTIAVFEFIAQGAGRKVSAFEDAEAARRQHRPITDMVDGVLLTSRPAPRRRVQSDFLFLLK